MSRNRLHGRRHQCAIVSEGALQRATHLTRHDRMELRNFQRVLHLLNHGYLYDMLQRPRFVRYLGYTPQELAALQHAMNARMSVMIARVQKR